MVPECGHVEWWILLVAFLAAGSINAQSNPVCGGELTQQSGVLTSPGYPENYPNNQRCDWTIRAGLKEIITVQFSRLDLEGVKSDLTWVGDTCPDYVRLYDGESSSSPLLATMCRIMTQAELARMIIRSKSNVLYVTFNSDNQGQRPGFVASYWAHECPEFTYGTETCNNTCTCNREHTAYCNNTNGQCICKKGWTSADCSQDVNECLNPKVEPCPYNYMECANNVGSFDCVCKSGLVQNASGECEVAPAAVCDQKGCSHLCVKISGQQQCYCPDNMMLVGNTCHACKSVAFGKDCRLSCDCIQNNTKSCDTATAGCVCLEGWTSSNCSKDIDECTELLGTVCRNSSGQQCVNTPGGYQCKGKSGVSSSSSEPCGGDCVPCSLLSAGCSSTLTDSSGVIQSPNYPETTYVNALCNWTIIAAGSGMTISFSISDIYIYYSWEPYRDICYYGGLEVYDGLNSSYPLLGRYCGYYPSNTGIIRSSGGTMFMSFYTDSIATTYRFKGTYSTSVYQVSTSKTTDPAGIITTPGFPVSYSYNVASIWTITVNSRNVVNLSFSDFGLGECGKDFVDIYDGKHAGAERIGQFCGGNLPRSIKSTGVSMHIIYSSVGSTSEKGFNGSYITDACWCKPSYTASCKSPTGPCVCVSGINGSYCDQDINECLANPCPAHSTCTNYHASFDCTCWNGTRVNVNGSCDDWGKTLYGPSGEIQSQEFPYNYPRLVNYTWSIIGNAKEVVTLRFSEFDVEGTDKCYKDAVEIYDGEGSDSKLLGQYCGKNIPALLRSTKPLLRAYFRTENYYWTLCKGFKGTYYVHECPLFMYGEEKCTNPCSCAYSNTRVCDNTNGVCFCKSGWVGRGCSQDLDECRNPTTCPKNSECINVPGNFSCKCNSGYVMDTTGQCTESSSCSIAMKQKCSHLCDVDELTHQERCYCPEDFVLLDDNATCVVSLYPYGLDAADTSYIVRTNGNPTYIDEPIVFNSLLPFGKGSQNNANILYNGVINFNGKTVIKYPDLEKAQKKGLTLLAPFWTKYKKNIGVGDIFYHVYETCGSSVFTEPGSGSISSPKQQQVFTRAIRDIKNFYNLPDFKVSVAFVVTWEGVVTKKCNDKIKDNKNTFQAVFVSGYIPTAGQNYLEAEERSFVIYLYKDGKGICLPGQPFQLGIAIEGGFTSLNVDKDNPQLTEVIGNTGNKGVSALQVGKIQSDSLKCQRYLCKHADLIANQHFQAEIDELYKCPCSLDKLGLQWQYLKDEGDTKCYSISAVAKRRLLRTNQRNRVCCYSWTPPKSDSWEDWHASWIAGSFIPSGHLLISDPWPSSVSFGNSNAYQDAAENMQARNWCCKASFESCYRFYKIFGDLQCTPYPVFVPASALGDPTITSMDKKRYFMNGWGEYILLHIQSELFILQARTEKVMIDGKLSNGTVFTAIAAEEGDSANVQVQLDPTGTSLIILANGNDFTNKFYTDSGFTWSTESVSILRINQNKRIVVAVTFACGVSFKVHLGFKSLEFDIEMDNSLKNKSIGLLGNNNDDPNDDFLLPNGTILSPNITERQIFEQFAKSYQVTASTSAFTYEKGESCADYHHPEFLPVFYDEISPDELLAAKKVCGDDDACVYDYFVTASPEFAINTKNAKTVIDDRDKRWDNTAPTITLVSNTDSKNRLVVYEGKKNIVVVKVTDADNDTVIIELHGISNGMVLDQNGTITYTPVLTSPISPNIQAKDSIGSYSPILMITLAVCPLCNNHGDCDTKTTTAEFYEGRFQILKCNCFPAYTGDYCEAEIDDCDLLPCSLDQVCTDLTAAEQGNSSVGYTCGPCPAGTTDEDGSCEDIDECIDNTVTNVCDQECFNTYGSYICLCRGGFRLDPKDKRTCIDINECTERTSACQQVCRNTPGSYTCACKNGYTLSSDGVTCDIDANISAVCQQCQQVCNVNGNGQVSCSCQLGFEIDSSNPTRCSDINECNDGVNSPCSQKCTNTIGGFVCSCYSGYKLYKDGVSCLECDSSHFGENCSSTCNCRGQGRCDRVVGCVCNEWWTGKYCDTDVNECASSLACTDGKVCQNEPGSYSCSCANGYRLENGVCKDIDECSEHTNRCDLNLEDCYNNEGDYICLCKEGFKLNAMTGVCEDINECDQHIDGCEHLCENGQGSYRCFCHVGYRLGLNRRSCEIYKQVCNLTCSHGCSRDDEGTSFCFCPRGYEEIGEDSCEDIDECSSPDRNPCSQKHRCNNTDGGYICSCDSGYRLENDGKSCVVCSSGTWGVGCNNSCACGSEAISCDPVTGCNCKPGCSGVHCTDVIDRCASGELTCQLNEVCAISGCSSVCQCRNGFIWDNGQCQDENECLNSALHKCDQICINTQGSFSCSCYSGYIYNATSKSCIDEDECQTGSSNRCDQVCTNTEGSYICSCNNGYRYNSSVNLCFDEDECQNSELHDCDQVCTNTDGSYVCSCNSGYSYNKSANTCNDVDECKQNPCSKSCVNTNGSYYCSCPPGQVLQADQVTCDCPNGCEVDCYCVENNTDHCNKTTGKCHCKKGWTSDNCSVDVNECLRNPCPDNRKCKNLNGSYECVCLNDLQIDCDGSCKDCNRTLTSKNGYIMSPNYPEIYQSNTYCSWIITVNNSNAVIALSFTEYNVEGCPLDYVKVYNVINGKNSLLAQVCDNWQTTIVSKKNSIRLVFTSDSYDNRKGFLVHYTSYVPCKTKKCSHTCSEISSNPLVEKCQCPEWMTLSQSNDSKCINTNACNTTITEPVGTIVSQNYPERYPVSSHCQWTIQGGRNSTVRISFYDFSLEYSSDCSYDSLTIYNGNSVNAPLIGRFCGNNLPPVISSSGNSIFIMFKTDGAFNYPGFRAEYAIYEK